MRRHCRAMNRTFFIATLILVGILAWGCVGKKAAMPEPPAATTDAEKMGDVLMQADQADQALAQYRQAEAQGASKASVSFRKGFAYMANKQFQEALDMFIVATVADPTMVLAVEGAGMASLEMGELDKAKGLFERCVQMVPDYPIPHAYLSAIAHFQNNTDVALAERKLAVKLFKDEEALRPSLMQAFKMAERGLAASLTGGSEEIPFDQSSREIDGADSSGGKRMVEDSDSSGGGSMIYSDRTEAMRWFMAADSVNIQGQRSTESLIVGRVEKGDRIRAGYLKDGWYAVFPLSAGEEAAESEAVGYVPRNMLKPVLPEGAVADVDVDITSGRGKSPNPKATPKPDPQPEATSDPDMVIIKVDPEEKSQDSGAKPRPTAVSPRPTAGPRITATPAASGNDADEGDSGKEKTHLYTILESSWAEPAEAMARVKDLKAKGVMARIKPVDLGKKGVWQRVMIGFFDNPHEAEEYKKSLSAEHGLKGLNILRDGKFFQPIESK